MIDFTLASYRKLLQHIQRLGHQICPLRDVPAADRFVILRHDVDYSVVKAVELAEIEHDLGVRASVFLMVSSVYYNLMSTTHLAAARRLVALGHEIGLHYDTTAFMHLSVADQVARVHAQARFLSTVLETPVTSVAQHNPSVIPHRLTIDGYTDAYADAYCKQIAYLSDSRRLWGVSDPLQFFATHARAQLLIHPLWWTAAPTTRWEAFSAVRSAAVHTIDAELTAMNASMERDEAARLNARTDA